MVKINTIAIIAITALLVITASATYFATMQNQVPIYGPVRFFEQEYTSTSSGGAAMAVPFDNLSSYLEPLSASFEISRRWGGVDRWADQGVSLWTILKSGGVIQYGFNSSEPVVMSLITGENDTQIFHTNSRPQLIPVFRVKCLFMNHRINSVNTAFTESFLRRPESFIIDVYICSRMYSLRLQV